MKKQKLNRLGVFALTYSFLTIDKFIIISKITKIDFRDVVMDTLLLIFVVIGVIQYKKEND